jgi:penicillin amidase
MIKGLAEKFAPDCGEWVLGKELHALLYASLGKRQVSHMSRLLRDNPAETLGDSRDEMIKKALAGGMEKLKNEFGENPRNWAWGSIRPLTLEHPFGGHPILGKVFNRGPFPWGGDSQTVAQAQRSLKIPTHNPSGIANLRMVLDVGAWENNLFVLAGGQSGNPLSPHYDDQLEIWKNGSGINLAWRDDEIKKATRSILQLSPLYSSSD